MSVIALCRPGPFYDSYKRVQVNHFQGEIGGTGAPAFLLGSDPGKRLL